MKDLIKLASELQSSAYDIFEKLQLNSAIANAEIKPVGSVVYNLMTWRDLDIDIRTENVPSNQQYFNIVSHLFENENIDKILLVDNRKQIEKDRPRSMYIGPTYIGEDNGKWKIDIRLLSKEDATTDEIELLIKNSMTKENRIHILQIKNRVKDNPKYHKGFSSVDIYKAVIENEVTTLEDFSKYLSSLGKLL